MPLELIGHIAPRMQARWVQWAALSFLGFLLLLALWSACFGGDAMLIDRACIGGCAPGEGHHWLGTDSLGRDLWQQLAGGAATALFGGLGAALGSVFIGYVLGASAAWWSRGAQTIPWWQLVLVFGLLLYVGYVTAYDGWDGIFPFLVLLVMSAFMLASSRLLRRKPAITSRIDVLRSGIRADRLLLWSSEVVSSVPALLLLLALASLAFRPGLWQLVLIYMAVRWSSFAVFSLQETRGVLDQAYVRAAFAGGIGRGRLFLRHIFPNTYSPLLVKGILAVGGFILVEGTFSFLGLGLPPEQASWGRVLAEAQQVRRGWWLWVFPGIVLLGSILSLQVVARAIDKQ